MDRETTLKELSGGDTHRRVRAAQELRRWNDPEVQEALVQALGDQSREVQETVSTILIEIGDGRAVRLLIPLLRRPEPSVRNHARGVLEQLARIEPTSLVELSRDEDARMRIFAANIIAGTGDHDMTPRLLELCDDPDTNVQDAAIVALGRIRATEAVGRLSKFLSNPHPWVQFSAMDALSKIETPEAVRALVAAFPRVAPDFREALIDALGQTRSPEAVDALVSLLAEESDLKPFLLRALLGPLADRVAARGKDPFFWPLVRAILELLGTSPSGPLAIGALAVLGSIGDARDGEAVIAAFGSGDPPVVEAAVRAAGRLKLATAVGPLRKLEADAASDLAQEIRTALSRIEER